jgi:ribonuclease HI
MELTAAIKAVEATAPGSTVLVCTASQLVEQGMTGWVHKWLHNGWCTGAGQPVENQDLWEKLRHLGEERPALCFLRIRAREIRMGRGT